MAFPYVASRLVGFSTNFYTRISAPGNVYQLTPDQIEAYTAAHDDFISAESAVVAMREDGSRSKAATRRRDLAMAQLLKTGRELYGFVQSSLTISEPDKILLGVNPRDGERTPTKPIVVRPAVRNLASIDRVVTADVYDPASLSKRGMLKAAKQAWAYGYVGTSYPSDPAKWKFFGASTNGKFRLDFDAGVPGGATVWVCFAWVNAKGFAGPVSVPVSINLQGGGAAEAEEIKVAA